VIAIDSNLLVYAHREESPWHDAALRCISELAEGRRQWAIPWPCLHEFLAIVTHPRVYKPPTPLRRAVDQLIAWVEAPGVVLLAESTGYWAHLRTMLEAGRVTGPQVHDARIAALCRHHGIDELWTADRDFGRFRTIRVRNPLVG
jgi:hypothetical protein